MVVATWTSSLIFIPLPKVVVHDLLIDPTNNNILYAATDDGLYKTINAGRVGLFTWCVYNDLDFSCG